MTTTIALITGANKGIRFETARQLGSQGVTVLADARDEERGRQAERALRDGGADAHFVQLDVTDATSVQPAAEWIEAEYGRLDILVNNAGTAGVTHRGGPPSQTSLDDMQAVYEINVFGVVARQLPRRPRPHAHPRRPDRTAAGPCAGRGCPRLGAVYAGGS